MLIEQDRSKPIAHVVKLFALIKKNPKRRCFPCKLIFETLLASPLRDENTNGLGILFKASWTQMCAYSSAILQQKTCLTSTPDRK